MLLIGDRRAEIAGSRATAVFTLREGERAAFALHHLPGIAGGEPAPLDPSEALRDASAGWRSWSEQHQGYDGAYRDLVRRSALVLRALTYVPTGAIVAAPTTSLGEVLEGAWVLRDHLDDLDGATGAFLAELAHRAARDWTKPDAGIWEGREGDRHYLSSKLLCWVALDRGIRLAPQLDDHADADAWTQARDAVRDAILEKGWSETAGAYAGAFGSDHLDASVLLMPILGFVDARDERMGATIEAIERDLGDDGLVQRWTGAGDEGAFVACSYWLAHCHALAGAVDRAREVFDRVTSHANDVGLLSEEMHRAGGELVGNFPQGLSHIALINAAWAIDQAERSRQTPDGT